MFCFFVFVFTCLSRLVSVSVQRHRRVASLCLSPTPSTLRKTVYVHIHAIDAGSLLYAWTEDLVSATGRLRRRRRTRKTHGRQRRRRPRHGAAARRLGLRRGRDGQPRGRRRRRPPRLGRRGLGRPGRGARVRVRHGVGDAEGDEPLVVGHGRLLRLRPRLFYGRRGFGSHGCFPPPAALERSWRPLHSVAASAAFARPSFDLRSVCGPEFTEPGFADGRFRIQGTEESSLSCTRRDYCSHPMPQCAERISRISRFVITSSVGRAPD